MKKNKLKTKIFLDSGDPSETSKAIKLLGFLDGQTTNPSLIAKNPEVLARIKSKKFTRDEIYAIYKKIAQKISKQIPGGSVSLEVYADSQTSAKEMLDAARELFSWIPNAHIKLPITKESLKAARQAVDEGIRVNMTLCFTQEQASAVYKATVGAYDGQVYISPFIGRLDDIGENGMDLISNILKMYKEGDGHVKLLAASVRNLQHFMYSLKLGCDIITAPFPVLDKWVEGGFPIPDENFKYEVDLKMIPYKDNILNFQKEINIDHALTAKGIERFCNDWKALIE